MKLKEQIIKVLKSYQAVFYFNNYERKDGIIWGLKSYDDYNHMYKLVRWEVANNRRKSEKPIFNTMAKFIRDNGSKFRCLAGGIYGYYYNKDQIIDFEPVDLVIKPDLGFTSISWLNPKTKEYELVG
jgi:hypothetical protein